VKEQWITSMGLDLGTSTTKMIISRLRLVNTGGRASLPRIQIAERQLVYASPIYTTPLRTHDEIDMQAISDLIQQEYEKAKVSLGGIQTGAVIITGETATKKNAEYVVHSLAHRAGDFVVATAGADLEAILAGKGSGASRRSLEYRGVIANIDIGGGTANTAFFEQGEPIGTLTFHVGGASFVWMRRERFIMCRRR
jgi:ethanolamine utilization protein EutA